MARQRISQELVRSYSSNRYSLSSIKVMTKVGGKFVESTSEIEREFSGLCGRVREGENRANSLTPNISNPLPHSRYKQLFPH